MITSIFPTICTADVASSRDFYVEHLGFRPVFDCGWYVQLEAPSGHRPQLGLVEQAHPSVPAGFGVAPAGMLVSIEVDDVDAVHAHAVASNLDIAQELRDEDFGQRHFMLIDPDGLLVDVITPIQPDAEYAAFYVETPPALRAGGDGRRDLPV